MYNYAVNRERSHCRSEATKSARMPTKKGVMLVVLLALCLVRSGAKFTSGSQLSTTTHKR